jgi:tetratricopeptide (TPR) repeat protein
MKRITLMLMLLGAFAVHAQKPVKPNLNKVQSLWEEGKFKEAKEMVDAATTYEKTKDDGKTYYFRTLVYASLDTIKDATLKQLDPNPFKVALESLEKANAMKGKSEYGILNTKTMSFMALPLQLENLSNYYLNSAIQTYQDDPKSSLENLAKARQLFEKHMSEYRNDTLAYYIGALVASQEEMYDLAIDNANRYIEKNGTSPDIYLTLYQIYNTSEEKKDSVKALQIIRDAKVRFPHDTNFPKIEIEMLINQGRTDEARLGLEEAVKKQPDDKLLHFYLGYINYQLQKYDVARKNFQDALKLDPNFYDAQVQYANTFLIDVDKISKTLNSTGNTPADSKKRSALIQERVKASEAAIPHLEKAEKMKAPDKDAEIELLNKLDLLYYYVADDKNTARVKKRMKELGVED